MMDLTAQMCVLRDEQRLRLSDALIRQAAKDTFGKVESLDRRFRMAGLPQPGAVLRQLLSLREQAEQRLAAATTDRPARRGRSATSAQPASPASDADVWVAPSWYQDPDLNERPAAPDPTSALGHAPASPVIRQPETPAASEGPPIWYAKRHQDDRPEPGIPVTPNQAARHSAQPAPQPPLVQWPPVPPSPAQPVHAQRHQAGAIPFEETLPPAAAVSAVCDAFESRDERLRVKVEQGRIAAKWPAVGEAVGSVVYLVCASAIAVPEAPDDGTRELLTMRNKVTLAADAGRFFAVFSYDVSLLDELATATAIRHAIGRVTLDVEDLQVTAEEHGVLFSWSRPPGVDRVRVMRSLPGQPLPQGEDRSLLVPFSGDTFRDTDIEPGETYVYRIYTLSPPLGAQDGSSEYSTGHVRTVTMPGRPDPVRELMASVLMRHRRAGITVSWRRPSRGAVRLYLAADEPSVETVVGVPQSAEQFAVQEQLLGRRLREPVSSEGETDSVEWVPLDTEAAGGRHSRWTVTATTAFGGSVIIGATHVVVHVGEIDELEIDERVDWQLLRSTWPSGAAFLGYWVVEPGERYAGPPHAWVTQDEFEEHGGIALRLPPQAQDVLVQGATRYGTRFSTGQLRRVSYPGRWVVRYELPAAGRFGGTRRMQLAVERPDWPDLSYLLIADHSGFPLRSDGPTVTTVYQGQLPGSALVPGQYVPAAPEVKPPRGASLRLLVWSSAVVTPIVVDPLDPPLDPPPRPPTPGLRCPRCLKVTDLSVQHFRCQGSCLREPDLPMTQLLHPGTTDSADLVADRPVFAVVRPSHTVRNTQVTAPPVAGAGCPRCGQFSHQHVCPHCHWALPPNWWAADVLGVVMIGARSSGKTTYLSTLMRHLDRSLLPRINGVLHPVDAESATKLTQLRAGLRNGELAPGTLGAAQNEALLRPMLASLGAGPTGRDRSLALFDVAGEDMSAAETVRPYGPALTGSDLMVLLIDPLQLDGVREWLEGTVPLPAKGAPAVTVVYNVVQEIRRQRALATGPLPQRAAVAFSKFDGLQEAAAVPQSGVGTLIGPGNALWRDPYALSRTVYSPADGRRVHDEVRALLLAMGESALVSLVEGAFREVQYFAVSALGHGPRGRRMTTAGASPHRVGDPLRWLLWSAHWDK